MKLFLKVTAIITVMSVLFSFSGCFDYSYIDETADSITTASPDSVAVSTDSIKLSLPYLTSDSLNPFLSKGEINQSLSSLMYDSLFSVGNDFKASPLMAKSYTIKDGKLSVTIRDDIKFSDLGSVSANDVVSSFEAAKKSERYKSSLYEINDAVATGTYTVVFEVNSNNEDICSLLTFPIVKTGTEDSTKTKSDVPIGSGRYILSKTVNNELYLTANQNRLDGYSPTYKNIGLVSTSDEASAASTFSLSHTNVLIDSYSDGKYEKYIGASNKQNLTNLVYIVCNSKNKIFDDPNVKKAISLALDRDKIADYSFIGYAKSAYTPFHPDYYQIKDYDTSSLKYNKDLANKILDGIGYTDINPQYNFRHSDGKILEFDLIVNKDNAFKLSAAQLIKEQLAEVSIYVNIKLFTQEDFLKAVSLGKYDMYLGECKLTNNLDLSVFFDNTNSASKGIPASEDTKAKYTEFKNNEAEIKQVIDAFNTEMPFIPLLYRCASVNSNSAMAVSNSSIVSDYYNNIDKWKNVND
ncbi:MAG: ABC transporter substrate-binding protein [Clostridia bacterium]|nr:ABC transporter substrate-binding protein [Clostridia bacterium]